MLTNPVMGVLALAILWVNTLLVAAAAGLELRALGARRAALGSVARGKVVRGDGPDGALAVVRLEQLGRAGDGPEAIVFHDRAIGGEVLGGAVETAGGVVAIAARAAAEVEVWLMPAAMARAAACDSAEAFDEAYAAARKARGFARTVTAAVRAGDEVFVAGGGALVATMDPRALLGRRAALAVAFIAGEVAVAGACTAVALWPPVFGPVSTVGGALCLGFFLLVQPAGTALRDALRLPSRAWVRGRWTRPAAPEGAHAPAA